MSTNQPSKSMQLWDAVVRRQESLQHELRELVEELEEEAVPEPVQELLVSEPLFERPPLEEVLRRAFRFEPEAS